MQAFRLYLCVVFLIPSVLFATFSQLQQEAFFYHQRTLSLPELPENPVTITASQFYVDPSHSFVLATHNVQVKYQDIKMASEMLKYDVEKGTIFVNNNVNVYHSTMNLSCSEGLAKLPVFISANGNVVFNYPPYQSLSHRAYYNIQDATISLIGDSIFQDGEDYIKGDTIVFDLDSKKVISQGRSKIKLSTERL